MLRIKRNRSQEAELDITAFLNLMIVLVPVLLLGLVFSRITVVDITLPDAAGSGAANKDLHSVELVIRHDGMTVNYPRGTKLKTIPLQQETQDFAYLSLVLQEVKRQLRERQVERRSITILSEATTDYQTIVSAIDTVRSFKALVAADVVDAELFPEISFGDAPVLAGNPVAGR